MADEKKVTLTDEEMVSTPRMGRRATLGLIGAGVVGAAVGAAVGLRPQQANAQAGNDNDSGANADAPGHGRTGYSDRDDGPNQDRPGHGVCPLRGTSDSDSGSGEDAPGHGRGPCHQ